MEQKIDVYKRQVHGSVNSHTAILARTMGIPALIGTDIPLDDRVDGKLAVVDGADGTVYVLSLIHISLKKVIIINREC